MTRLRRFSTAVVATAALASGCTGGRAPAYGRPPIVIVDIDTLRADHLGAWGYARATSPSIDAFAANAKQLTWAFAQAPNTAPSQASILSGLYPSRHGRLGNTAVLPDAVVTLAETLRAAGYATAAFVDGGVMAGGFGLEQGFERYDDRAGGLRKIGPRVRRWLRARERAERPFFLLIHTYDVHSPYELAPDRWKRLMTADLEPPSEDFRRNLSARMAEAWGSQKTDAPRQLTDTELAWAKAMYDSGIRYVDDWFGRLVEDLRARGLWEQSIVVLVSDHGDEFQEHGSLFHEKLYASVTRVPLIIKPVGESEPAVIDTVVETIDLMPTLLEMVGAPVPPGIDGESLLPLLEGGRLPGRQIAMSESPFFGRRVAVTARSFRLLFTGTTKESELYEYRRDPLEQDELGNAQPSVRRRLERGAWRWYREMRETRREAREAEQLRPETLEQLKALGYIR